MDGGVERSSRVGKLLWHTMMSLDGFIAGPNDDMDWVFGVDGGDGQTADEVVRSTGALLVGRRTAAAWRSRGALVSGGGPRGVEAGLLPFFCGSFFLVPFFVLRHDPPAQPP